MMMSAMNWGDGVASILNETDFNEMYCFSTRDIWSKFTVRPSSVQYVRKVDVSQIRYFTIYHLGDATIIKLYLILRLFCPLD